MKTLTKMKKVCCLSRFVLLVMALGMTSIFTSCSSDDDENIPVYSLKDVEGTYSGKMQTTSIAPLENAENEAEDGVTVNAELKDNHILISKFPVEDLIKSIIEDPDAAEAIIKAVTLLSTKSTRNARWAQLSTTIKTISYFKCHLNPWYWKLQWNHNP